MNLREEQILYEWARPYECKYLYKYRSMSSLGLDEIFKNKKIYLSSPLNFNDPFDCHPKFTIPKTLKSFRSSSHELLKRQHPDSTKSQRGKLIKERWEKLGNNPAFLEEITNKFMSDVAIYSMSELNDDILMWSHYCDSHKGICLEFRADIEDTFFYTNYKVKYQDDYPAVNALEIGSIINWLKALAVKSSHWQYEQERRIIMGPGEEGPGFYDFELELLTSVILGAFISDKDEEKVLQWVDDYGAPIEVKRAKLSEDKYEIVIE